MSCSHCQHCQEAKAERRYRIKAAIQTVFDNHPKVRSINAYSMHDLVLTHLNVPIYEYGEYTKVFQELIKDPSSGFYAIKGRNGGIMRPSKTCACGVDAKGCAHHGAKQADPLGVQSFVDWFSKPAPIPATQDNNKGVVNDYTCGCGNTKCNTTEKSCWRCGAPIQVKQ